LLKSPTTSIMEASVYYNVSLGQNVNEDEEMEDFVDAQPLQCPPLLL
jgi:hypothetical protein